MKFDINTFKRNNSYDKEVFYYTSLGNESFFDKDGTPSDLKESKNTYAKKIKNKLRKQVSADPGFAYYIKAYGTNKLFNPYSQYTVQQNNKPSKIENLCKSSNYFLEVNEYIFNKYLNYLRTKNKQWLIQAQKDI